MLYGLYCVLYIYIYTYIYIYIYFHVLHVYGYNLSVLNLIIAKCVWTMMKAVEHIFVL